MAKSQNHQPKAIGKSLRQEKISFSWGYPDLETFPIKDFNKIVKKLASNDSWKEYFQYSPGPGISELREEIVKQKMGDFGDAGKDEIIIAPGATFGIFLLSFYFKNKLKADKIGIFLPCYDTALEIFKIIGLGIVPLSRKSFDSSVKYLYLMPRYSNPGGEIFDEPTKRLIEKYIRNGARIIEDDVYHIFKYKKHNHLSLKTQFPNQIYYLDSFSKILAPGLRLGYIVAPKQSIDDLIFLQKFMCSSSSTVNQKIACCLLRGTRYKKIANTVRDHYITKMNLTVRTLRMEGLSQYFTEPLGGYYIWLRTQRPYVGRVKKLLYSQGVNLVGGDIYFLSKGNNKYVRLSIANIDKDEIIESIKLMKKYLYER